MECLPFHDTSANQSLTDTGIRVRIGSLVTLHDFGYELTPARASFRQQVLCVVKEPFDYRRGAGCLLDLSVRLYRGKNRIDVCRSEKSRQRQNNRSSQCFGVTIATCSRVERSCIISEFRTRMVCYYALLPVRRLQRHQCCRWRPELLQQVASGRR